MAHIARMEEKLTERINLLMNSSHRTDSDEGELEDVFQEVMGLVVWFWAFLFQSNDTPRDAYLA